MKKDENGEYCLDYLEISVPRKKNVALFNFISFLHLHFIIALSRLIKTISGYGSEE